MRYVSPTASRLTRTLAMIAGDAAEAAESDAAATTVACSGVFVDDAGTVVASCDCDIATAAALGCALSMIPPGGAEGMVEDGALSAVAASNLYECMNMFSSLLMEDDTDHLRLDRVESATPEIAGELHESAFRLELGRYGGGGLLFRFT